MKIGIDRSSPDQSKITFAECGDLKVEFVDINYMQLFQMLKNKQIDAAVWNIDEIQTVETFPATEFQSEEAIRLTESSSEAAIVIDKSRADVKKQIALLDEKIVLDVQKMVERGERLPKY